MFKPSLGQKKGNHQKKVGPGWFKHMIYLPLSILQKEAFLAKKKGVYDLPFLAQKTKVDHKLWPPWMV